MFSSCPSILLDQALPGALRSPMRGRPASPGGAGVAERRRVWETLCPARAPLGPGVDFEALAKKHEITGGMIKNALLRAAYLACEAGTPITGAVLEEACTEECRAAGKLTRVGAGADSRLPS